MKNYQEKLRYYAKFLETEIATHRSNEKEESLQGSIAEGARADVLESARDRLYSLFPELRPQESQPTEDNTPPWFDRWCNTPKMAPKP